MVKRYPPLAKVIGMLLGLGTVLYMVVPLFVVVGVSVSESQFLTFPPQGFTLDWYWRVLGSSDYLDAAVTSLRLALLVAVSAILIGAPAGIALARGDLPGSAALSALFLSPLMLPVIIFGIGLLLVFSIFGSGPSFTALWLGHTVITLPYVVRTVVSVMQDHDPYVEDAARIMGATWWQRYRFVIIPRAFPGIVAGGFFAFSISVDETVIALFLRTPGLRTLPLEIYNKLEYGPDPSLAAVSTLMIMVTLLALLVAERIVGIKRI